jgi:hypothetical protein
MFRLGCVVMIAACAAPSPASLTNVDDLVGTWRFLPHDPSRTPVEERELVELRADGHYTITNRHGPQSGTFELDGNELTIYSPSGSWISTGVAASADRLLTDAVFRTDGSADLVGTWTGTQSSPQVTTTIELELRPDGTAHVRQTGSLSGDDQATWQLEDPFAILTFTDPVRERAFPVLPGVAIGEWMYERLP